MAKMRAIDAAREYKKRNVEDMMRRSEPEPLAGLKQHRCERYIYLQLKAGESPRQQWKAACRHWKELYEKQGELPAGFRDQGWLLTLPDGDSFCDFCVVRFPSLVTETEEQMIPRVEKAAALFREFASATGRCTAVIEDQAVLVCVDGRRVSLAECTYRVLTDDDFAPPRRKAKTKL